MKKQHAVIGICLFLTILSPVLAVWAKETTKPPHSDSLKVPLYLGQTPPGDSAIVFAPDLVSTDTVFAGNGTFSPDGREFYFTVTNNKWDYFEIRGTKFVEGSWSIPTKVGFLDQSLKLGEMEPCIAPDGKRIYFNAGNASNTDIWYCDRTGTGWGTPTKLPAEINTSDLEWHPSVSAKNTLYITSKGDILRSRYQDGHFGKAMSIGSPVITANRTEGDPYISPNEDYLLFQSMDRAGGFGQADIYISYRKGDGSWTNPKNVGPKINSGAFEFGSLVTRDGKYYLFSRREQWLTNTPSKIYWISADFIERLRHTNFVPYAKKRQSDQTLTPGQAFSYAVPEDAFIDDDGNNTLTYSAVLENGESLPAWLSFNPATRTFSGTPDRDGATRVRVVATDNAGASAQMRFIFAVPDANGRVANGTGAGSNLHIRGEYFGQSLPGNTPVPFAPEILKSVSPWVEATDFSPDGARFLMSVGDATASSARLLYSTLADSVWTPFVEPTFTADFIYANEPHFSANGAALTFTGKKETGSQDLWIIRFQDTSWGQPVALPSPINSDAKEWRGSTTLDGKVYFSSDRAKPGMFQLYQARRDANQQWIAEKMGAPINLDSYEGDPCVAPDGHFLIFSSGRNGANTDLFVSFRDQNGGWGGPINLGNNFNTSGDEYGAHLSADGKYLFFTRHTKQEDGIFWVATEAIEKLAPPQPAPKPVVAKGPYLGQKLPGETPVIFAPEFLSARYHFVARLAFSPDGSECYFTVTDATYSHPKIMWTRIVDGIWSEPTVPGFADEKWCNHEPFMSQDGTKLYFTSNREAQPGTNKRDFWQVERTSNGWGEPKRLPAPINSDYSEYFLCQASDGTTYFGSNRPGGNSQMDIYRVRQIPGQAAQAENLGPVINGGVYNGDACIAPDGRFLVFGSVTTDGRGGMDIYVTFPDGSGGWTAPVSLGDEFNTAADEYGPTLSPDQEYLFFTRHDGTKADVNWVRSSVLEKYRAGGQSKGK